MAFREEQLERIDADETLCHGSIEAVTAVVRILFGRKGDPTTGRYGDLMSRLTVPALATAALLLVFALTAGASSGAPRTVLHYGDSLTVGTGVYLPSFLPGWSITESASISRHADEGPGAVRSLSSSLPRVLVFSLGANDDPGAVGAFAADVRRIATTAGHSRCVIWSTVVRPPYNGVSYEGYNRVLRRAAGRYANFRVFDWQALAKTHPQWFGSDGVHPTAAGYRVRAAVLARLVRAC
jgi:lysophospholipase L1-like esterase